MTDEVEVLPGPRAQRAAWSGAMGVEVPEQLGEDLCGVATGGHQVCPVADASVSGRERVARRGPSDDDVVAVPRLQRGVVVRLFPVQLVNETDEPVGSSQRGTEGVAPAVDENDDIGR